MEGRPRSLMRKDSYACCNPQIPGLVKALGSNQGLSCRNSSGVQSRHRFDSTFSEESECSNEERVFIPSYLDLPLVDAISEDIVTELKRDLDTDVHRIRLREIYKRFGVNPHVGLSRSQVKVNLKKYGENILRPPAKYAEWRIFLQHLFGGFSFLLFVGAALCFCATWTEWSFLLDEAEEYMYVGIVLTIVIFVSAACTYYTERKSNTIINSFKKMVPQWTSVMRNGFDTQLRMTDLVVGDIVQVKSGDLIQADIRLIECFGLKVDNSALTGDPEPQSRCLECTHDNPLQTKNLIFYGTCALKGHAKGVVVNVGERTLIGRLSQTASKLQKHETPIHKEVEDFVHMISTVAVIIGISFFISAVALGDPLLQSVIFLVGIICANVPEGLLATVTVCLALSAKNMTKKNCLVQHLEAVETLGFTSCICVDKTGVLTANKMAVSHLWFNDHMKDLQPMDYISVRWAHSIPINPNDLAFVALTRAAALCNRAAFCHDQYGVPLSKRKIIGDGTDTGILRCVQPFVGNILYFRRKHPIVHEIPFSSTTRIHVTVHEMPTDSSHYLICMKGAPEVILEYCRTLLYNNREVPMSNEWVTKIDYMFCRFGELGERVLGFCDCAIPRRDFQKEAEFTEFLEGPPRFRFLGLMSLVDPVKPCVSLSMSKCHTAGIKVIMMTGDHPSMAKTVARAVGIISENSLTLDEVLDKVRSCEGKWNPNQVKAIVVHGDDLKIMESCDVDEIFKNYQEIVFARITPQQKLMIVESCQRQGWATAVTGDGVADSPALKRADVGVALGLSAADVAKEASDMILLDNSFSSLVSGIEEGRLIFDNLKRCVFYTLTDNVAELAHFFVFLVTKIPLPLGTISILCLDLGTDIVPSVSLIYVQGESDVMKRPPRSTDEKLVSRQLLAYAYGYIGIIESFAGFFSYLVIMGENGWLPRRLLGIGDEWNSEAVSDLQDSYGQEWTFAQRKRLEIAASTAYFVSIVITQWGSLVICKTVRISAFHKQASYAKNIINTVNFALVFETLVAAFLIYTPGLAFALNLSPLKIRWWLPALPFSLLIIAYDEIRRYIIRHYPHSWFASEFSF